MISFVLVLFFGGLSGYLAAKKMWVLAALSFLVMCYINFVLMTMEMQMYHV